jgi:hypothetical protein
LREHSFAGAKYFEHCCLIAPPPIQLPAIVDRPFQTSSPLDNATSGKKLPTIYNANGPPIIIPTVPAKNMMTALLPNLLKQQN